jgi:hypothetical protein
MTGRKVVGVEKEEQKTGQKKKLDHMVCHVYVTLCQIPLNFGASHSSPTCNSTALIFRWILHVNTFFFHGATAPSVPGPPHYRGFTITLH